MKIFPLTSGIWRWQDDFSDEKVLFWSAKICNKTCDRSIQFHRV
jgi:hypothetical protein